MTAIQKTEPAAAKLISSPAVRGVRIETMVDLGNFGRMLAQSGYFKDARDAVQACVKVQAGLELGISPVQAMSGIHIVEGKPSLSAGLVGALIKRSGKYNYRVVRHTDKECALAFFEDGEKIGESSFTIEDAARAGLAGKAVWKSYAKAMLFNRALTQGARWHCPDVFNGPVYVPEELGAEVNGEGEAVGAEHVDPPPAPPPQRGTAGLRAALKPEAPAIDDAEAEMLAAERAAAGEP